MSVDQDGEDLISKLSKVFSQLQLVDSDKAPARAAVVLAGLGFSPEMQAAATRIFSAVAGRADQHVGHAGRVMAGALPAALVRHHHRGQPRQKLPRRGKTDAVRW